MVFTTTNLFKGIACPEGEQCQLTSCIFTHDLRPTGGEAVATTQAADTPEEPASKRRKVAGDDSNGKPLGKHDRIREQLAAERKGVTDTHSPSSGDPPSLHKPVTPPPTYGRRTTNSAALDKTGAFDNNANTTKATKSLDSTPKENLNPRLIPNDPAGHAKRTLYLKHIHIEMVKLNQRVADAKEVNHKHLLHLSEQELIKMALDEEESLAKNTGSLYPNKMKQQIATYRKMDTESWISHVKVTVIEPREKNTKHRDPDVKVINTGLSPEEEPLILPHLVADQTKLVAHGYIPTPPTEEQAAEARAAVEASKNFEVCDRCGSRFQVFPERSEEGLLTSNGPCRFHPNKKVFPQKTKNDYNAAAKEPYHPCCNGLVGSNGCTMHENHVFKCSAPSRLAAVLPFITTPENPNPKKDRHGKDVKAVSFDCEMGYTTCGLELIRLTAVSWPHGEVLVDVLVRPVGTIIDLNSRFSGVFPEHFAHAIPHEQWEDDVPPPPPSDANTTTQVLPVVDSIPAARALLTAYLAPSTPLIGHAIDNDLNATRICHPTIIDTVLLFRHPRGMPFRFGLRQLSLQHLGKKIQQGGERGHDSAEDARATGELVRVKVGERWGQMMRAGWRVKGGVLGRLDAKGEWIEVGKEVGEGERDALVRRMSLEASGERIDSGGAGRKRKKGSAEAGTGLDGAADEEGESTGVENGKGEERGNGLVAFLPKK